MGEAWKAFEDRICMALGGRRVLGNRGSGVPDSDENVPFALECKLGFGKYALHSAWIEQARKNAKASGKPWAIVQKPKHVHRAVVTLDFWVFAEMAQLAGMIKTPLEVGDSDEVIAQTPELFDALERKGAA